jgi:acyl-CoA reductase-like NAD-dependent aldehyde dehydrogenase
VPRVTVTKTCKLFVNGAFPRSESGRALAIADRAGRTVATIAHASRKDFRDAVEAAAAAQPKWASATAYNRGQILYRAAEMVEARHAEFVDAVRALGTVTPAVARREVTESIDRLVCWAGWTDKIAQVLGNQNPVAGPYFDFTVPEPIGVAAVFAPDRPALLGLVSLLAPAIAAGNACVAVASDANPLPAVAFMESLATSDLPAGVVNILTGKRDELVAAAASHREVGAIVAAGTSAAQAKALRLGVGENLKRVRIDGESKHDAGLDWTGDERWTGPDALEALLDHKTIWHPSAT